MTANARGENRQQNSSAPVSDTIACVLLGACAVALIPATVAAMLIAVPGATGFCLGRAAAQALMRAWRHAATAFTGIPAGDRKRFKAELLSLYAEMAREAARADRERAGGGEA